MKMVAILGEQQEVVVYGVVEDGEMEGQQEEGELIEGEEEEQKVHRRPAPSTQRLFNISQPRPQLAIDSDDEEDQDEGAGKKGPEKEAEEDDINSIYGNDSENDIVDDSSPSKQKKLAHFKLNHLFLFDALSRA
jgi:hypothetical protein